ncbi:Hypothetical predicted protein, partial [Pelobates cultripes]
MLSELLCSTKKFAIISSQATDYPAKFHSLHRADLGVLIDTSIEIFLVQIASLLILAATSASSVGGTVALQALTPANYSGHMIFPHPPALDEVGVIPVLGGDPYLLPAPTITQWHCVAFKMAAIAGSLTTEAHVAASLAWLDLIFNKFWANLAARQQSKPIPE